MPKSTSSIPLALLAGRRSLAPPPCSILPSKSCSSAINWQNLICIQNPNCRRIWKWRFSNLQYRKAQNKRNRNWCWGPIHHICYRREDWGRSGMGGVIPISFRSREMSFTDTTRRARNVSSALCSLGGGRGRVFWSLPGEPKNERCSDCRSRGDFGAASWLAYSLRCGDSKGRK